MLGCAKKDTKKSVIIVGKSKPSDHYKIGDEIRYFKDKRILKSSAESVNYMAYLPDLQISDEILIYSDLCKNSRVADSMVNILKIVPVHKQRDTHPENERVVLSWGSDRIYQPLVSKDLYRVRFDLRSVSGSRLKLKSYVRVCVHIREKND